MKGVLLLSTRLPRPLSNTTTRVVNSVLQVYNLRVVEIILAKKLDQRGVFG
jgi:hypothetical protein